MCMSCLLLTQDCQVEMGVVMKRQQWLAAVLEGDEQTLAAMCESITREAGTEVGSTTASSAGEASLARAGPCPGFEHLQPFSVLRDHAVKFRSAESTDQVKQLNAEVADAQTKIDVAGGCARVPSEI